jgi:hypothetical protein
MLQVIVVLIIVGILLWAVNTFIPMDEKIKKILNVVTIILVVIYLLNIFGVFGLVHDSPVPKIHR